MEKELGAREIKAVFYDSDNDTSSMVDVVIGDKDSILKYLKKSSGKAKSFAMGDIAYWMLESTENESFLLFRLDPVERFTSAEEEDIALAGVIKQI